MTQQWNYGIADIKDTGHLMHINQFHVITQSAHNKEAHNNHQSTQGKHRKLITHVAENVRPALIPLNVTPSTPHATSYKYS